MVVIVAVFTHFELGRPVALSILPSILIFLIPSHENA
jgi:hypothetical protein